MESTVLGKRRIQYEEELSHDANNYVSPPSHSLPEQSDPTDAPSIPSFRLSQDTWFSYARLEEDAFRAAREDGEKADPSKVRDIYERGVAQVPPGGEKRLWRRYIFLWLFYAAFEELESKVSTPSRSALAARPPGLMRLFSSLSTQDYARARQVYKAAIQLVPHRSFTFAKVSSPVARRRGLDRTARHMRLTRIVPLVCPCFSCGSTTRTLSSVGAMSRRPRRSWVSRSECAQRRSSSRRTSSSGQRYVALTSALICFLCEYG